MNFLQYYLDSSEIFLSFMISIILFIVILFLLLVSSTKEENKFKLSMKIFLIVSLPFIFIFSKSLYDYYIKTISLNEQKEIKTLIKTTLNTQKNYSNDDEFINDNLKQKIKIIQNLNKDLKEKYYNSFKEIMSDDEITYGEFIILRYLLLIKLNEEQLKINENENEQKNKKEEENILKELKEIKNYVFLPSKN